MDADEKRANRAGALLELARQPVTDPNARPLPNDWQRSKPSDVVDDVTRAATRHGVPVDVLARVLYQEGKFNEPNQDPNHKIVWSSSNPDAPIGWAQITTNKLRIMRNLAEARGDRDRAQELASYSLANREQSFDLAAEILAYQQRLLGSWHASVAACNVGDNFMNDWLTGRDLSEPYDVIEGGRKVQKSYDRDPNKTAFLRNKWQEMKAYLPIVFHQMPDETPATKIYDYRDPEAQFRVAPRIPRSPRMPIGLDVSRDTRDNP